MLHAHRRALPLLRVSRATSAAGLLLAVWQSASPPVARAVSATVVISEFRVRGPNGGSDEFVELYNLSSAPVNIGGWKIRGSNSSGTVGDRSTIPAGTLLGPGCHYLLTNSSTSGGPYSGSVPGDRTYSTGVTDDGGIALTLADNTIIDQVGMSNGSAFKEGTPLANLGSSNQNRGYERKPGGAAGSGTDTDNNSADFALVSPSAPQNLASPCIGGPTNPSGSGSASPGAVFPGDPTQLSVNVTPGANPTSTGIMVTANLSAIGGSNMQPFFDDGTNGDASAGDNTFSFLAVVAGATASGPKSLPVTITDDQNRTGTTSISLGVNAPLTPIHTIQGNGGSSALAGQSVSTRGVVTAIKSGSSGGFFVQMPDDEVDSDPDTSEGLFVFTGSSVPGAAAVGNLVVVTGTVQEFIPSADPVSPPITEISGFPTVALVKSGQPLPEPITLTASDTSPAGALDQLERYEGMRVKVDSLTVVAPTQGFVNEPSATGGSNGVFFGVIGGVPRPFREPGIELPNPLPAGAPCCVPRFDGNPERLRVDSDAQPGAPTLDVATGAVLTGLVGPLDYSFRTHTILPDPGTPTSVVDTAAALRVPDPQPEQFTIASFNLQRFFDTVNDPGIGEPVLSSTAFARRLHKASLGVREVMRLPDILGVQEVENLSTLDALAAKLNEDAVAAGGPDPGYVAYLEEGNDPGGIDSGFLVKTSKVAVVDVTQQGKDATYVNPLTGDPELLNDRPPLILRAEIARPLGPAYSITVIVNHLRSLSDVEDPVQGPRVRAKRRAQAEFLANLIQGRQSADPNERIISIGDYNAFQFNDGLVDSIGTIKGAPTPADEVVLASDDFVNPDLVDLVDLAPAAERYSFLFGGNAQELDHILITQNLLPRADGLAYARMNADFPETLRNDGLRPERLSDHDPLVAYFSFPPNTPPVADAGPDAAYEADASCRASVTLDGSGSSDADGDELTYTWTGPFGTVTGQSPNVMLGLGEHTIELTVDDGRENGTHTDSVTLTVVDATAPSLGPLTASPAALWPPNHQLVDVLLDFGVSDACGTPSCGVSVTSSEPSDGTGDGDTGPDWEIIDAQRLRLRAERAGSGSGRVYTITLSCTDAAGNTSTRVTTVVVPKSKGK
jgi:predicted extracellular nuclease